MQTDIVSNEMKLMISSCGDQPNASFYACIYVAVLHASSTHTLILVFASEFPLAKNFFLKSLWSRIIDHFPAALIIERGPGKSVVHAEQIPGSIHANKWLAQQCAPRQLRDLPEDPPDPGLAWRIGAQQVRAVHLSPSFFLQALLSILLDRRAGNSYIIVDFLL